jgi:hypothetical protein
MQVYVVQVYENTFSYSHSSAQARHHGGTDVGYSSKIRLYHNPTYKKTVRR